MSSTKLSQLRATLSELEAYELPEKYRPPDESNSNNEQRTQPVLDEDIVRRYKEARNEYLKRRTQQVFYDYVATYDESSSDIPFQMPSPPSQQEKEESQAQSQAVQRNLTQTATQINRQMQLLQAKHAAFVTRREELGTMIQELAETENNAADDDNDSSFMDDLVDEEEMALEEQRLASLTQRRTELEAQLRGIRAETVQAKMNLEETQSAVEQMRQSAGASSSSSLEPRTVSPETITMEDLETVEQVEAKTTELRNRVKELREMSEWYDSIRNTVEELGGIRILSVDNAPPNEEKEELHVKIQLLGKHEVQVGLSAAAAKNNRKKRNQDHDDELVVTSASFLTPTLVTEPPAADGEDDDVNKQDDDNANTIVQMTIPPLDDLVRLSAKLGPVEDLRFLLREAMGRIRTITNRVQELAVLRKRYLTKIGKSYHYDYGFGGEDQEIVCSLNEGVTVVLRLSPDCPMVDGSVRIDQIVGVGGWGTDVLEQLRTTVNDSNYRGPLALMDGLVSGIERVEREEGVSVPLTPAALPSRKAV